MFTNINIKIQILLQRMHDLCTMFITPASK